VLKAISNIKMQNLIAKKHNKTDEDIYAFYTRCSL